MTGQKNKINKWEFVYKNDRFTKTSKRDSLCQ